MNIENLDIRDICCFGYSQPKDKSWLNLLRKASPKGWKNIDKQLFEKQFADNVEATYYRLASLTFNDLDSDTDLYASFDNGLKKWTLEIPNSPADAVDPKDVVDFFNSDLFKKYAKRFSYILNKAHDYYIKSVKNHVENGEFLSVDETKLEAIEWILNDPVSMQNLKTGKYQRL